MNSTVEDQAPRTRCYKCGDPTIAAVCHHCGQAMCRLHEQEPQPKWLWFLTNAEFTDLGLDEKTVGEKAFHCKKCLHFLIPYKHVAILALYLGVFALASIILFFLTEIPVTLQIFAFSSSLYLLSTFLAIFLYLRYRHRLVNNRPPLPTIPKVQSVILQEYVKGQVTLDSQGNYRASTRPQNEPGSLKFLLKFSPLDRDRSQKYYKKFNHWPRQFHAGFAILQGAANLSFNSDSTIIQNRINTIEFKGSIVDQRFLAGTQVGHSAHWQLEYPYTFNQFNDETAELLPVQLVPRVVHEGGKWALEFLVQVHPNIGIPLLFTAKASVENLTLYAPMKLGKVERTDPPALAEYRAEENGDGSTITKQEIRWKRVGVKKGVQGARCQRFYVRFTNSITPEILDRICGRLHIRFNHAISGLERVTLFYPLGNKRPQKDVSFQKYTEVELDFDLNLHSLSFQEMLLLNRKPPIVRDDVIPDYRMLKQLVDALCESGIYVQRVIENPPRTNRANAQIINRFWDIAGRYYRDVYPIDFHLVLIGQEHYGKTDVPDAGRTQFEITVQSTVINQETREHVDELLMRLEKIIDKVLNKVPQVVYETPLTARDGNISGEESATQPRDGVPLVEPNHIGETDTSRNNQHNGLDGS